MINLNTISGAIYLIYSIIMFGAYYRIKNIGIYNFWYYDDNMSYRLTRSIPEFIVLVVLSFLLCRFTVKLVYAKKQKSIVKRFWFKSLVAGIASLVMLFLSGQHLKIYTAKCLIVEQFFVFDLQTVTAAASYSGEAYKIKKGVFFDCYSAPTDSLNTHCVFSGFGPVFRLRKTN